MNIEEIKALQEIHYRKAKEICYRYYDNEIVYKHTFIDDLIDGLTPFIDKRPEQLHLLIEELQKIENRIKELETLKPINNDKKIG